MSLSIVAAKNVDQAFGILSARPRKAVKDYLAEEPEEVGRFLYDFRAAFTNSDQVPGRKLPCFGRDPPLFYLWNQSGSRYFF